MIRKLTAILLTAAILLSLPAALADGLMDTVTKRGSIVIATEGAWAPWTYHDDSDALVGFDVEVARAIAEKLGLKADFVECPWESIFMGIDSGMYDITANGVEITDERAEKYNFTEPFPS